MNEQDRRLLILDDDPLIGETIKRMAEMTGLQTSITTEPREFFRSVEQWQPSHIALDLIMPQMDGVEVMEELAELDCQAQLIIYSGVGTRVLDAASRSAREHGLTVCGVLKKPFSAREFRHLLGSTGRQETSGDETGRVSEPAADAPISIEELRTALREDQLYLVYQPKVTCQGGDVTGFEALVRWQHPQRGEISPGQFIPVAERHGEVGSLTDTVLEKSLAWLGQLREQAGNAFGVSRSRAITLSVNLSAQSLGNRDLINQINAHCRRAGVMPEQVILELTETSAMVDPVLSLDLLTRLRMHGFHLSIDDFGTGFSSMLQLVRLPFSEIKVDKSFVITAAESQESRSVIKSIVELGRSLGLRSTAEGVESAESLEYLREVGCDLAQGFHIGRPMVADEALEWLMRRSPASA